MTDKFEDLDDGEFRETVDEILKRYKQNVKFLKWVTFVISQEKAMKDSLEFDEYQTRDYFARKGVEMLPGEVRYLMDAVEGILTAFDFFKEYKDKETNHDYDD